MCHSPTYFFSNSPVKCLLTKVVFPTPPSPTSTSLNCTSGPAGAAPPCCIRHTEAQTERQICNGWAAAVQREPPALPLSVLALFKSSRHRRYLPLSLSLSLSPSLPLSLPPCLPLAVPPDPALPHCLWRATHHPPGCVTACNLLQTSLRCPVWRRFAIAGGGRKLLSPPPQSISPVKSRPKFLLEGAVAIKVRRTSDSSLCSLGSQTLVGSPERLSGDWEGPVPQQHGPTFIRNFVDASFGSASWTFGGCGDRFGTCPGEARGL